MPPSPRLFTMNLHFAADTLECEFLISCPFIYICCLVIWSCWEYKISNCLVLGFASRTSAPEMLLFVLLNPLRPGFLFHLRFCTVDVSLPLSVSLCLSPFSPPSPPLNAFVLHSITWEPETDERGKKTQTHKRAIPPLKTKKKRLHLLYRSAANFLICLCIHVFNQTCHLERHVINLR